MTQRNGYWRATVTAANAATGDIRVVCADLYGPNQTGWIPAVAPAAAMAMPTIGDQVWLGFEKGDDNYPLWTGLAPTASASVVSNSSYLLSTNDLAELSNPAEARINLGLGPAVKFNMSSSGFWVGNRPAETAATTWTWTKGIIVVTSTLTPSSQGNFSFTFPNNFVYTTGYVVTWTTWCTFTNVENAPAQVTLAPTLSQCTLSTVVGWALVNESSTVSGYVDGVTVYVSVDILGV